MKTITQSHFDAKKTEALNNQPLRKVIQLGDVKFITSDTIQYAGLTMGISKAALRDLCNMIGVSSKMNTEVKSVMGEEFTKTLLNVLKDAISKKSGLNLTMVVGRDKIVRRFMRKDQSIISNKSFFDLAENLIDKHNLGIDQFTVGKDGAVHISTISPNSGFGLKGFNDETFTGGLSLSNSIGGVQVDPYIQRLVCTNGMATRQFEEAIKMNNLNASSMKKFHESLRRLEKNNFQPIGFTDKLETAMKTPASLAEMLRGMDMIKSSSNIEDRDVHQFINYSQTVRDYKKLGVEVTKLNHDQQKNAKTALSVWDVINGVTDFASHDYGYEMKSAGTAANLQMRAGEMLCKESFDTSNLVLVQPNY